MPQVVQPDPGLPGAANGLPALVADRVLVRRVVLAPGEQPVRSMAELLVLAQNTASSVGHGHRALRAVLRQPDLDRRAAGPLYLPAYVQQPSWVVDVGELQARGLAQPKSGQGADRDERAEPLVRRGQAPAHLLRGRDLQRLGALALPGEPDAIGGVDADHPVPDRGPKHRPDVHEPRLHGPGCQRRPLGGRRGHRLHPGLDVAGADRPQGHRSERGGAHRQAHGDLRVRGPHLSRRPLLEELLEGDQPGRRVHPGAGVELRELWRSQRCASTFRSNVRWCWVPSSGCR